MADGSDTDTGQGAPFGIFISYRRSDNVGGHAGRLRDALTNKFDDLEVFFDVESMPRFMGLDFEDIIVESLESCSVFLAMIGDHWTRITQERADEEEDWVRREIAAALERKIRVVPLLVEGATMPNKEQLPDDIKALVKRQGFEIRGSTWQANIDQIADMIRAAKGSKPVVKPETKLGERTAETEPLAKKTRGASGPWPT